MTVTCTSTFDPGEYEAFLDGFAAAPRVALAYHYPFYLRFLTGAVYPDATLRLVLARDLAGRLVGALPGIHVQRGRFDVWLSLAYFGPNAGALVPHEDGAVVRALVSAAREDASSLGCGSMTIYTPLETCVDDYRQALGGAEFERQRIAQWMRLPEDAGTSPWPRKVRHDIRRAADAGVIVRMVENAGELDRLWAIYEERATAHGIPVKPRAHIQHLFQHAGGRGCFLVAEHEGEVVGGLICLFGGGVISYYLPCATPAGRRLQAGLLLLDEAVRRGRAAGCRVLNFESSPGVGDDPVFRFKERCGGTAVPYYIVVKLLRPGVLDAYRALTPGGVAREMPFAYVVPFDALAMEN